MQLPQMKQAGAVAVLCCAALVARPASAADSVCASVRIEIQQEVTLERQAFDATMKIHNGLADVPLTDVGIVVSFADESGREVTGTYDPNQTNALFFIREASLSGIDGFSGGTVDGGQTAELHWLIIPAYGAGGTNGLGRHFFVGATLAYKVKGATETVTVVPDRIWVKPMPMLTLDYFLPHDVMGDDPLTPAVVEPSIPYNLGVRALNAGSGPAENLKIDSAQPRIVDNQQGVLLGFELQGTEVNGIPKGNTLLVNFGTVPAGKAGTARWIMSSSLAGRFTAFDAWFTHADELGGELTSLLREVRTHTLVRDVLVDLPDRDSIRDFLAQDGDTGLRVFESDAMDSAVSNVSPHALLTWSAGAPGTQCTLTLPKRAGGIYTALEFPQGAQLEVESVQREDGKQMSAANVWIDRSRAHGTDPWTYSLHLFDFDGGGRYVIDFGTRTNVENQAPQLAYVGNRVGYEGQLMSFLVQASDPDLTIPSLSATGLPVGATFEDLHDGTGVFVWTPPQGGRGVYPVRFMASDDEFTSWRIGRIYVGLPGERLNSGGLPESLESWSVAISRLNAYTDSGVATVGWYSVEGVFYDMYASDNPFAANPAWAKVRDSQEGRPQSTESEDTALGTSRMQRYYQVVLAGDTPATNNLWGVIRCNAAMAGYTLVSPPLRSDRRFNGEMGRNLAAALQGDDGPAGDNVGDEVYLLQDDGRWRVLYVDRQRQWRESNGSLSTLELQPGQGFFVARNSGSPATFTFTGPVGNDRTQTNRVALGWNIIGLSEGRPLSVQSTFLGSDALGGRTEENSDLLIFQNPDGSWRRLMYVQGWGAPYDGNWFDLSTFQITTNKLQPGAAYYYFRQPLAGPMDVRF